MPNKESERTADQSPASIGYTVSEYEQLGFTVAASAVSGKDFAKNITTLITEINRKIKEDSGLDNALQVKLNAEINAIEVPTETKDKKQKKSSVIKKQQIKKWLYRHRLYYLGLQGHWQELNASFQNRATNSTDFLAIVSHASSQGVELPEEIAAKRARILSNQGSATTIVSYAEGNKAVFIEPELKDLGFDKALLEGTRRELQQKRAELASAILAKEKECDSIAKRMLDVAKERYPDVKKDRDKMRSIINLYVLVFAVMTGEHQYVNHSKPPGETKDKAKGLALKGLNEERLRIQKALHEHHDLERTRGSEGYDTRLNLIDDRLVIINGRIDKISQLAPQIDQQSFTTPTIQPTMGTTSSSRKHDRSVSPDEIRNQRRR